ncbi:hypothetical protein [Paraburkholderia bryophila]|jgi:hypothetical protein|uniref:Uncharacterized protein n=1 Tax=Paraburkholderia bryophila TaxID=420952 RepID=A0A329CXU2_9BURK|nr:hypothetical protein [Paraburkholderia bryophila]RAS39198.1 hypothetical protein BX591_101535 [Paraburkholderia bryophila]
MSSEKSKRARRAAEDLFGGLPAGGSTAASRPSNPFGDPFADSPRFVPADDLLVTLPAEMELPPGYADSAAMRDALTRAWRMDWIKVGKNECVVRLPVDWIADKSVDGVLRIKGAGIVRAEGRLVKGATLLILPRYYLKAEFHDLNEHCRIVVRDRARNNAILKESFWDTRSGPNHPQWKVLSDWLDTQYPEHRDPLRYWDDCEDNVRSA